MKIVTIGRGTIGGGLAALWRAAGHEVDEIGRDGGDRPARTSYSSLYPGITPALKGVSGLVGKTAIDATNIMSAPEGTFPSYAEEVSPSPEALLARASTGTLAVSSRRSRSNASGRPTSTCPAWLSGGVPVGDGLSERIGRKCKSAIFEAPGVGADLVGEQVGMAWVAKWPARSGSA